MHFCGQAEVHLELIDHETGEPKPFEDGADGELVYTAVEREATPLVRFRSHDHVKVMMSPTPSRRTAPRITTLGRTDDMLPTTPDLQVTSVEADVQDDAEGVGYTYRKERA